MTFTKIKKILEENGIEGGELVYLDIVSGIMGTYYYYEISEDNKAFEAICNLSYRVYMKTSDCSASKIGDCIMDMIFEEFMEEEYHISLTDVLNDNVDIGVIEDCLDYCYN